MRYVLVALGLLGCGSDLKRHTRAYVASTSCGQGPYDLHLVADGKTGEEGVEVIACTPRRIAGHVELRVSSYALADQPFGDTADNRRCLASQATITTAGGTAGAGSATAGAPGGARSAPAPALVERAFTGSETPFADRLCAQLGLEAQTILMPTVLARTDGGAGLLAPGADLHVRLWSDAPNDLEGVVFMIRHLTSTRTPAEVKQQLAKDEARGERGDAVPANARPVRDHGPPPPPLAEARARAPDARAEWIAGYWTWTGSQWGWVAGFWRDARVAVPAPRVEVPGSPPAGDALWIGGTWELRAGAYVWIRGRWRR